MAPLSIAVIGCGPSGMAFCHAVESALQNKAQADNSASRKETAVIDENEISVTCFEQSWRPGGVWKAADATAGPQEAMNMYDALWTNGPSHTIEFKDYTFDEHFGRPVTVYLTRSEVLGYLVGRVTKNCPDFFGKYVQFGTRVSNVKYDETSQKFQVTTVRSPVDGNTNIGTATSTETSTMQCFDKVVWACGDNGRPFIPDSLRELFNGFHGRFIHSSDTSNFERDVRGKRLLLIGGGYSVEDLALQAIKLGVKKVYVSTRDPDACGLVAKAWPYNKVEILSAQAVLSVENSGRLIKFGNVEWSIEEGFYFDDNESVVSSELADIDTVICCTGYKHNYDMLDNDLKPYKEKKYELQVPDDWTMPDNSMTEFIGNLTPGKTCYYTDSTNPELYQGVLIRNPNMMFVWSFDSDFPLMSTDASAWLLASFCTGNTLLPSSEDMVEQNQQQALCEMKLPYYRYYMDRKYHEKVNEVMEEDEDRWAGVWESWRGETSVYQMKLLARHMLSGNYSINIGDYEELNDVGNQMLEFDILSENHRLEITPEIVETQPWKTFRDYTNGKDFYSLQTGTHAVNLTRHWLDIGVTQKCSRFYEEEKKNNS